MPRETYDYKYKMKLNKIKEKNNIIRQKQELKAERNKYKTHISTSKLYVAYLFIVLNIILVYAMVSMWHFADLSYLGVLITDIAAQILTFLGYIWKSGRENTKGGIKYEATMLELRNNCEDDTDDESVG